MGISRVGFEGASGFGTGAGSAILRRASWHPLLSVGADKSRQPMDKPGTHNGWRQLQSAAEDYEPLKFGDSGLGCVPVRLGALAD